MKPEDVQKLWEKLDGERGTEKSLWQELFEYALPRKADVTSAPVRGEKKGTRTYDPTAPESLQLLASSLQGSLTSTNVKWFGLKYVEEELNGDDAAMTSLGIIERRMAEAIRESNFRLEIYEILQDILAVGTSNLYIEPATVTPNRFEGVIFKAYPIQDYCIRENSKGFVDSIVRKIVYTARQAVQEFGEENVGKKVLEASKKEPDQPFTFYHLIDPEDNKFKSIYTSLEDKITVKEEFFFEMPFVVSRWSKISGEVYGRGPTHTALPGIRSVNKASEYTLKMLPIAMQPPLFVPEGIDALDLSPLAQNPMRVDLIDKIRPSPIHGDMQYANLEIEKIRDSIRRIYFTDQLQIQKQAQMTATESTITFELMQRLLGPVYSRLEIELFKPLIERVFGIMQRGGVFRDVLEDNALNIEYMGPLARAQKMAETQAANQWIAGIAPLAEINPEIMDNIDFDKYVVSSARNVGVPEEVIRDRDEVASLRKARQEANEQVAQQEQEAQAVDMITKFGKVAQ